MVIQLLVVVSVMYVLGLTEGLRVAKWNCCVRAQQFGAAVGAICDF